jgi:hypothetical protein
MLVIKAPRRTAGAYEPSLKLSYSIREILLILSNILVLWISSKELSGYSLRTSRLCGEPNSWKDHN